MVLIRPARVEDAAAIAAIYAPYVLETTISFEEVPPGVEEMAGRIASITQHYPYFVAEADGAVIGYAYASQHRTRAAYRTSVDVAVYTVRGGQRRGVGRALYSALLPVAAERGYPRRLCRHRATQ